MKLKRKSHSEFFMTELLDISGKHAEVLIKLKSCYGGKLIQEEKETFNFKELSPGILTINNKKFFFIDKVVNSYNKRYKKLQEEDYEGFLELAFDVYYDKIKEFLMTANLHNYIIISSNNTENYWFSKNEFYDKFNDIGLRTKYLEDSEELNSEYETILPHLHIIREFYKDLSISACEIFAEKIINTPSTGVYFLQNKDLVKIGFTSNLKQRIRAIQTSSPFELKLLLFLCGTRKLEKHLHLHFKEHRVKNEWFKFNNEIEQYVNKKKENNDE